MRKIKIKKIEFQNFRAFENKTEFNFLNDEIIADFVCIYGNNGMGKSSFVDGIEWFFTGEVDRIKNDTSNYGKSNLSVRTLRNIYNAKGNEDNKDQAIINMELSNQDLKTRKTDNRGNTDYTNGIGINDVKELLKGEQILAHSQIERFIVAKNPSDKFKSWCEIWDIDNEFEQTLKNLYKLKINISKQKVYLKKREENLKNDLKSIDLEENSINQFNDNIKLINDNSLIEDKIFLIKKSDEIFEYPTKDKIFKTINILEAKNNKIIDKINAIDILIEKHSENENVFREIKQLESRMTILKNFFEKASNLENNIPKFCLVEDEFLFYKKLYDLGEDWINKYLDIVNKKSLEKRNDEIINRNDLSIKNLNSELSELIKNLNYKQQEFDRLKLDFESKELECYEVQLLKIFTKPFGEQIKSKNNLKEKIKEDIVQQNETLGELEKHIIIDGNSFELDKFNTFIKNNKINFDFEQISNKQNKLIDKQNELKLNNIKLEKLTENLNKLEKNILDIREYIENNEKNTCPVCKTEFDNKLELLEKIDVSFLEENKKFEISNIANINNQIDYIIKELEIEYELWNKTLTDIIKNIKSQIEHKEKELQNAKKSISDLELRSSKVIGLNTYFNELASKYQIIVDSEYDFNKFKSSVFEIINNSKIFIQTDINIKKNELEKAEDVVNQKTKENIELQIRQEEFFNDDKNKEMFYEISDRNTSLDWHKVSINYEKLKSQSEEMICEVTNLYKQILDLNISIESYCINNSIECINSNNITEILVSIKSCIGLKWSKINEDLIAIQKCKRENYSVYAEQIDKMLELSGELENLDTLNNLSEKFNQDRKSNNETICVFKDNINTDIIEKIEIYNSEFLKMQEELKKIDVELEKCSYIDEKLKELFNNVKTDIENNLSHVYSNKIMKEIYNAIEPKKEFNDLKYEVSFDEDTLTPELYIKVGNSDGEYIIPDFYFSSAQLNTLSLSLFLGNALTTGKDSGKIDTIFIDDPVAHFDDINTLAFIDLIRSILSSTDRQIVITTHDQKIFNLFKSKLSKEYYNSKFIEFSSIGTLKQTDENKNVVNESIIK